MIALDILSDPVCPWCWIGKTYLDRALERRPDHQLRIAWHPFQLNPDMPPEGVPRAEYLEAKFGGRERAAEIYARIDTAATQAGLRIDWSAIPRMPNTLNAHRLIHWAGIEGRQSLVVDRLFRAYFQQGRDIGDADVLADVWAESALDRATAVALLATDADADDIRARDADARAKGVGGVPTFVLARQQVVQGAQPTDLWEEVIDEIKTQLETRG